MTSLRPFFALLLLLSLPPVAAQNKPEYLPVCLKCLNPRVVSKSGVGTANAVAEARVVPEDAKFWCASNKPRDPYCPTEEVKQGGDGRRTSYRATADCAAGWMKSIDSGDYKYAGVWTEGPGAGRPLLRDPGGNARSWESVVTGKGIARSEWVLYSGYSLAGQWEVLCGTAKPAVSAAPPAAAAPARLSPVAAMGSSQSAEWLSVCSRCPNPTVVSKSGIGTANARAEARMTRAELQGWCSKEDPQNVAACLRRELAENANKVYRASADCTAGRITPIDEMTYTLAGIWDGADVGAGRTKWKGADGAVVGRNNASNGLAISQQWELLCPGPLPPQPRSVAAQATPQMQARPASVTQEVSSRPAGACMAESMCTEVSSFAATVTDFRTSNVSHRKVITTNLRFQNKLSRPVMLGYVSGSGIATDDQGNRYEAVPESVRGIGAIGNGRVDPKFVIRPGESADARFEMVWGWSGREIFGLRFDMELTVREVVPLQNGQLRLGPEHPLRFMGLTNGAASPAAAPITSLAPVASGGAAAGPVQAPAAPAHTAVANSGPDPCTGLARCFNAGAFVADIQQISSSVASGRFHVLRFNVRLRNITNQPLILAATHNSLVATDNQGNRYGMTPSQSVAGMGMVAGNRADPNFVLGPGQSRSVAFQVWRRIGGTQAGTSYTFDVSLEQLEVLPSQQIRSARQFALNFPNLTVSPISSGAQAQPQAESLGETGKKLLDAFRGKKK